MPRDDAHHQPRTGAGIAEFERLGWRPEAADAASFDLPNVATLFRQRAEGDHRFSGVYDVLGFEKPRNARCAGRQRPENQRPVRNRFIAGNPHAALERRRPER